MNKFNMAIIGGGASGMMAAIFASKNNRSVVLIDRNDKLGKKVLATGNGRCNVTNINASAKFYHGANPEFINEVLAKFGAKDTVEYFESLGVVLKEEDNGRIFPRSNQAETIVRALNDEIEKNKVNVMLNSLVRKINKNDQWELTLQNGNKIIADKLIIACGGKAAHEFGTSGDGYYWAKNLGHKIVDIYPALAPIEIKEEWVKKAQGIKIEARVTAIIGDKIVNQKTGDLIFTHFGVSGPDAMAMARFIAPDVAKAKIVLDLTPDISEKKLLSILNANIAANGAKKIKNIVAGIIPINLSELIIKNAGVDPDKKAAEIGKIDRTKIIKSLKYLELTPTKVRSFKEAQVTRGGIDASEINAATMMSKIVPNLYFTGEIIDVDGESGGFNLQWAWSTGYIAGNSASNRN